MLGLHSHAACHPPPRHGIPGPAGLWGSAPGQEGGCKMNHSCNMRESTWSLWRSLKTLRLWQAGPRLLPEGPGLAAAGGHAGAESCRTHVAMSQGRNGNTAGHFSGAGATGKPLAKQDLPKPACRLCLPLRACGQPGSAAADPLCQSKASCEGGHPVWTLCTLGSCAPCNLSLPPLVLEGMGTDARTRLLLIQCLRSQVVLSIPCGMLKM